MYYQPTIGCRANDVEIIKAYKLCKGQAFAWLLRPMYSVPPQQYCNCSYKHCNRQEQAEASISSGSVDALYNPSEIENHERASKAEGHSQSWWPVQGQGQPAQGRREWGRLQSGQSGTSWGRQRRRSQIHTATSVPLSVSATKHASVQSKTGHTSRADCTDLVCSLGSLNERARDSYIPGPTHAHAQMDNYLCRD